MEPITHKLELDIPKIFDDYVYVASNSEDRIPVPFLFSPNVFIKDLNEIKTYGPRGYQEQSLFLEPFMIADYESASKKLIFAKKHHVSVGWRRKVVVKVHEARALESTSIISSVHDVRCKVNVAGAIERTTIVEKENEESKTFQWNQTFTFEVADPCDIKVLLYCKNAILPNYKLGRLSISPDKLVERKTVSDWFKLDTHGELKLSILLSAPVVAPFVFALTKPVSFEDCFVRDFTGKKIFKVDGTWPHSFHLYDGGGFPIINIIESLGTVFNIYKYGSTTPSISVRFYRTQAFEPEFEITGVQGLEVVVKVYATDTFKFFSSCPDGYLALASVLQYQEMLSIEISPEQDILLILASFVLIAKLLESAYYPSVTF